MANEGPDGGNEFRNQEGLSEGRRHLGESLLKPFPEWHLQEKIKQETKDLCRNKVFGYSEGVNSCLPLEAFTFGSEDPTAPCLILVGGVHGLERIGAQVVLSLLNSFSELVLWDDITKSLLQKIRIAFFPMVNPLGILNITRANPRGVDLMRNAPVEALEKPTFLLGGHRLSPRLPWYRGKDGLEVEARALIDFCRATFFESKAVISVDFHSGFGLQDQLWFPYAKTKEAFPHIAEMQALSEMFRKTHPHHFYKIEPQSLNYTTHGDLWDYIYDLYREHNSGTYIPLALEMGSWLWIKKNPLQLFSSLGPFNPIKPHRQKRILRRHMTLFDFLIRVTLSNKGWAELDAEQKNKFFERALENWYR